MTENSVLSSCYDAAGKWEGAYNIDYKSVFGVEFESRYLNYFNDYMRPSYDPLQRAGEHV